MKKNPVIPYAIIAGLGLIAVIIISVIGIDQRQAIQNAEENGEEATEQTEGEEGGESTSADAGEEVFQTNCSSCHGQDLASGPAPDLTEIGSKYSQEEIAEIVENGTDAGMPAFPQLQGDDLDALTEWLSEHQ
ncbi:cytochrome c [Oceanobacillus sp. FSL W8-0428]|uniref:Cytochrome c domain-containing protein n=1 Tax=Oceanobacillus sojae TaxID=582851 RepID=A0A511ZFX0_9BACI|nr:cytochrome c [Oceanobacillus sojae]GEN86356.1 hypothetical protein OSO01_10950 [Oceanobacillus sojae]